MFFERISFPFKIPDLFHGFAEAHGIVKVLEDTLVLEYQVQDAVFGIIKSRIRELRIPLASIDSIVLRKRWWQRYLVIQTDSLRIPAAIPGNNRPNVLIRVHKQEKLRVQEAISRLTLRMSEIKLERIENW